MSHAIKAITMTTAAAQYIETYLKKQQAKALRLTVKKSGCSGLSYETLTVSEFNEDDEIFAEDNAVIVVAKADLIYYAGTVVDYVQEGLNKKLVFNNPLAENVCGCGQSFQVKQNS